MSRIWPSLPLVSLVTPSFNHAAYIRESIHSVLTQDYPCIEYIIVDGGSTDGTLQVLNQYGGRFPWTSGPDQGPYDAVNKGWSKSHGEYVGFLNSDDVLCLGAVSCMVAYLQEHTDTALVYGDYYRIDQAGRVLERLWAGKSDLETLLKYGNTIFTGAMLLRRSVLDSIGWMDINLKYAADYDFFIRVAHQHQIGCIHRPLAMFRVHTGSKSQNSKWKMWQEALDVSYKYSHKEYFTLHSRYWIDRLVHVLPQSFLWRPALVPIRKSLRRLWQLGS